MVVWYPDANAGANADANADADANTNANTSTNNKLIIGVNLGLLIGTGFKFHPSATGERLKMPLSVLFFFSSEFKGPENVFF